MRRLLLLLTAVLALHAAPARAAGPEVGIADDRVLLAGGAQADAAIEEWVRLGVRDVRIFALWSRVQPSRGRYDWSALDAAVNRVVAAGMTPMLTITGPGAQWTSRSPGRRDPRYDPDPDAYAVFAAAVAERYGDRVDRYILWNEPNLGSWLRPQSSCTRGRCTPVAPHLYRALVRAAYPAVHAADPGAQVLIGAMSSRGSDLTSTNATERPLVFLRGLACVTASYAATRASRCAGFSAARADGFAFHPHGVLTAPDQAFPHPDDVNLASLPRLEAALDRLQRAGRLRATTRRFGLYLDEYGYQTNPPDGFAGVSAKTQDAWLQRAAYAAWRDPRVKLLTQYIWRDEPSGLGAVYEGWQSGLRYADGRAKPSLAHFPTPFVVDKARGRLWGQVRRRDAATVTVQRRLRGASWRDVATATPDARGYWSLRARIVAGASYRFLAAGAVSATMQG